MPILDLGDYEPRNGHIPAITAHHIIGRVAKSRVWRWITGAGLKDPRRSVGNMKLRKASK